MKIHIAIVLTLTLVAAASAGISASGPVRGSASASGNSFNSMFSADARHIVFVSHANNLGTNDDLGLSLDVFVRDLVNSDTVLVSVSTSGLGGANADANYPSISSNGQFIAFASRASNLVAGDTNDASDVFVRDTITGTTRLVSLDSNGNSPFDPTPSLNIPLSGYPMISGDGRWVFFESRATNLIAGGAPLDSVNIYGRDTWSNVTVLVSADATLAAGTSGKSVLGSLTPDARYVAFSSTGTNIIIGLTNTGTSIYLRDMQSGQIVWATTNCIGCDNPVIDNSGRIIAYFSRSTDGGGQVVGSDVASVIRHDRLTGASIHLGIATDLANPIRMSADGNAILYNQYSDNGPIVYEWKPSHPFGTNGVLPGIAAALSADGRFGVIQSLDQLWRVALTNDSPYAFNLVSENMDGMPSAASHQFSTVTVSSDGSRVAFDSIGTDMVSGDLNGASDIFVRDVNTDVTQIITRAQPAQPTATAFAHSFLGLNSIGGDGRFIVTLRYDDPSAFRDTNGWRDVFVSDVVNGRSAVVSISSNAYFTNVDGGTMGGEVLLIENTNAFEGPVISADGSTIYATRRSPVGRSRVYGAKTTNAMAGGGMFLASRGVNVSEDGNSYAPSVSSNGALVVFTSTSTDLIPGAPGNNSPDVFLRGVVMLTNGLLSGSNELISISMSGFEAGSSSNGVISPDSRWVIFESRSTELTTDNTGGRLHLFARDLWSNTTHLVSMPSYLGLPLSVTPASARFSGNSLRIAYTMQSGSSLLSVIHDMHDMLAHNNIVLDTTSTSSNPVLDESGRFVAYQEYDSAVMADQVYVRDLDNGTGQIDLISANLAGGGGNRKSSSPLFGRDARYVVFQSQASNLVANDSNGVSDVFVRDRLLGTTLLVSANAQGLPGNGPSSHPVMAADGRTVAFQSFASDLVTGDYNDKRDVFVLKLGGADTDSDGLDDDWEVAYFINLSRNGTGDFDGDGASDLAEFLAGTDPTNSGSIFRVLTVTPVGGGATRVMWSGNPGRAYRVEYKDDLNAADWTALSGTISWNGSTASITDPASINPHRFYRVVRLP